MLENPDKAVLLFLAAVVVSSGCIQSTSTDLKPDFDLPHEDVELNRSGQEVYQDSMSQIDNISAYGIESDNLMAMNLPVISVSVNMSSEGEFEEDSSEINSSGKIGFNLGGNSNTTDFSTQVISSENGTVINRESASEQNRTELERYSREELRISLEALEGINLDNATVLGTTQLNGTENILLELDPNSSDLMQHSARVFELHSPIQESAEGEQQIDQAGEFNQVNAYLWTERDDGTPSKFAYYGSVSEGSLQIRSVTEYSEG